MFFNWFSQLRNDASEYFAALAPCLPPQGGPGKTPGGRFTKQIRQLMAGSGPVPGSPEAVLQGEQY